MPESESHRPASPIDYAEMLERQLPAGRKPYILARLALAKYGDRHGSFSFEDDALLAIIELHDGNKAGTLEPPLSDELAEEVGRIYDDVYQRDRKIRESEDVALVLAWAIDEGSLPGKTTFNAVSATGEVCLG